VGRGNSDRAFRAARRHSRVVRTLRVAIPLAVVLGFTGVFLLVYFNPLRMLAKLPVDIGSVVVAGTKITMEKPHLSGFTQDARAYELSADMAKQDVTKPDIIELRNIRAKVQMQDKSMMELSAATGVYDSKGDTLKLNQNILLSSSTGYSGRLSEAMIDIRKGYVVSTQPVEVEMLQGTLNAKGLEIVDSGDLLRFEGGVSLTLMLSNAAAPPTKTGVQ
jgi:lipopolysaccharide export system protein LptC